MVFMSPIDKALLGFHTKSHFLIFFFHFNTSFHFHFNFISFHLHFLHLYFSFRTIGFPFDIFTKFIWLPINFSGCIFFSFLGFKF